MDTGRLTQGQLIAAGSAALLLLSLFLPWIGTGIEVPEGIPDAALPEGVAESFSGWEANNTLDIYLFILVGFALIPAVMRLAGGAEELPFLDNAATFLLGAIGTIMTLYVLIDADERKIGLFLAALAVIGVTVGAYMAMQEEGAGPVDEYR
jgi:hypothetical protein